MLPVFDSSEFAEVFCFFYDPGFAGGDLAVAEVWLEGVEFAFEVTSFFAEDDEARAWNSGHHGGAQECTGAFGIVKKNVEGVVGEKPGVRCGCQR